MLRNDETDYALRERASKRSTTLAVTPHRTCPLPALVLYRGQKGLTSGPYIAECYLGKVLATDDVTVDELQ